MPDDTRLDQPRESGLRLRRPAFFAEGAFGTASEAFARFMGTPRFLLGMTLFCIVWLGWNTLMPEAAQFDPRSLNFTLLTLILSLQASYAAPLLLLAQNRQDDRDRVTLEQDRARDERNLADTEFLTREVAALRVAMRDVATRDYLRSELRELLEELAGRDEDDVEGPARPQTKKKKKHKQQGRPRTDGTNGPDRSAGPARFDAAEVNALTAAQGAEYAPAVGAPRAASRGATAAPPSAPRA